MTTTHILTKKTLHIVGASSMEMTATLLYLRARDVRIQAANAHIVLHDLHPDIQSSLLLTHCFYPENQLQKIHEAFEAVIAETGPIRVGARYLEEVEEADEVFAPQSWYVHPRNAALHTVRAHGKLTTFADLCFRVFPGKIIAVTGTVGKSTTAKFTAALTAGFLSGNDRENILDLCALADAKSTDILVFETSNRHLHHGLPRKAAVGVLTNICPNHIPDHGSLSAYADVKHKIFLHAERTIYNAQNPYPTLGITPPAQIAHLKHYTFCGALNGARDADARLEDGSLVVLGEVLVKSDDLKKISASFGYARHEQRNVLAAALAARLVGIEHAKIRARLLTLEKPRYRCEVGEVGGRVVINNAGACLPECTRRLIKSLDVPFILVAGGDRQVPMEGEFDGLAASILENENIRGVFLVGKMQHMIAQALGAVGFGGIVCCCGGLEEAVSEAVACGAKGEALVFSPGCGVGGDYVDKYERGRHFDELLGSHYAI